MVATSNWSSSLKNSTLHSSDTGGSSNNVLIKHSREPSARLMLPVCHTYLIETKWDLGDIEFLYWYKPWDEFHHKAVQKDNTTASAKWHANCDPPLVVLPSA